MEEQQHVSTFEEISDQLNNPDCNEVILGINFDIFEQHYYNTLIIYKKLDENYIYRELVDNVLIYENICNNTCIEPVISDNQIRRFKIKQPIEDGSLVLLWSVERHSELYQLLELMMTHDWKHPQINEWLENPCFK